jgi:hypothetical protein
MFVGRAGAERLRRDAAGVVRRKSGSRTLGTTGAAAGPWLRVLVEVAVDRESRGGNVGRKGALFRGGGAADGPLKGTIRELATDGHSSVATEVMLWTRRMKSACLSLKKQTN